MNPTDAAAGTNMWRLRYAPHLGVGAPDQPLFRVLAGSAHPATHIRWLATQGFAGAQYAWAVSRPEMEQQEVAAAFRATGLEPGVIVWTSRQIYRQPLWGCSGAAAWGRIRIEIEKAVAVALTLGASIIGIVNAADPTRDIEPQRTAMAQHLSRAADLLIARGMTLGLEPMVLVPNMLLKTFDDGREMLERVRHPGVRLIFDTAHVSGGGDDVVQALSESYGELCLVQLADHPGRLEPGTGSIDFPAVLGELLRREYRGLVELEHFWSAAGAEMERAGLAQLRELEETALQRIS